MSALEIIEQIKSLPPDEKAEVVKFVHDLEGETPLPARTIHYALPDQAEIAGDRAIKQYEEVFRNLAK